MKPVLPNLIIAGAPKCGTSSVHQWLAAHPQALGSIPKETGYFVDPGSHIYDPQCHITNGLEAYCRFFQLERGAGPRVVFETTPAYLYQQTAIELAELASSPRFLFILREPSTQIRSLYSYYRDNWDHVPANMDFATFCAIARTGTGTFRGNELCRNAIANADYRESLLRWRARIGPGRMRIMLFEDLQANPQPFMQSLCQWLNIDPAFYANFAFARSNETYAVHSRALQRFNLKLRPLLSRLGAAYSIGRRVYRLANTSRPRAVPAADRKVMRDLQLEFAPANARLAQDFGLDLAVWAAPV